MANVSKTVTVDLSKYTKEKESENYIVYFEKNPVIKDQKQMIVYYKKKGTAMQCILTDALYKLFFKPEEFSVDLLKAKRER